LMFFLFVTQPVYVSCTKLDSRCLAWQSLPALSSVVVSG
jgi:hypothetical protein